MKFIESLRRVVLSAVILATVTPVVAQDRIPWITDLRQAREAAERQHRLVLLHFWSEDCIPCKQVERNVFNHPEFIRSLTTGYIPVKINAAKQPQLAEFYNIERVPTDVIVTPEGKEVHRFQSLQDSNQYIAMLDGIRAQASTGQTQLATRSQQASTSGYSGYAPGEAGAAPYDQAAYGQAPSTQSAQAAAGSTQGYTQNGYANPLDPQTTPQQQDLAPRYANPYAQQGADNSNTGGSRWGQPTQSYGSNDTNATQPPVTPQANGFVSPGTSVDPQQGAGASRYRVARAQPQPMQNPTARGSATQPGYAPGGQSQYSTAQLQPSQPQPSQSQFTQPQPSADQPPTALEGYCPVTLVQNRVWTPGHKKFGAVHEGRVYLFAGPEQQKQFLANPAIYAPLMAGYDPVRFAETGQLVPGRREFGLYIDEPGPIALFADEAALERFHANANYYFNVIRQAKQQQAGRMTR